MDIDSSVRQIMTRDVITVNVDTSIAATARLLWENHLSGVPVVDGTRIVGMVTEFDLISQESEWDAPLYIPFIDLYFKVPGSGDTEQLRRILAATAGQLMAKPPVTVGPDATVQDVATLMYERRVNPIPVVTGDGDLVGIVSRADIVRMMAIEESVHETSSAQL